MSTSSKPILLVQLKKMVREKFPIDWASREFILQLPDRVPENEFFFLAKTLDQLVQPEIERMKR